MLSLYSEGNKFYDGIDPQEAQFDGFISGMVCEHFRDQKTTKGPGQKRYQNGLYVATPGSKMVCPLLHPARQLPQTWSVSPSIKRLLYTDFCGGRFV